MADQAEHPLSGAAVSARATVWYAAVVRRAWPRAVDLRVAWLIAEAIDQSAGSVCLSHREIGEMIGVDRNSVQGAAKRLETAGFLIVASRDGRDFRNIYQLSTLPVDAPSRQSHGAG